MELRFDRARAIAEPAAPHDRQLSSGDRTPDQHRCACRRRGARRRWRRIGPALGRRHCRRGRRCPVCAGLSSKPQNLQVPRPCHNLQVFRPFAIYLLANSVQAAVADIDRSLRLDHLRRTHAGAESESQAEQRDHGAENRGENHLGVRPSIGIVERMGHGSEPDQGEGDKCRGTQRDTKRGKRNYLEAELDHGCRLSKACTTLKRSSQSYNSDRDLT